MTQSKEIDRLGKTLWNYLKLNQPLRAADIILVLGNQDIRTAKWAVQLYQRGLAPLLVLSGGKGYFTEQWQKTEAEIFAELARAEGVPEKAIILEKQSTNTAENVIFSLKLLAEQGVIPEKIIVVQRPHMERRVYATLVQLVPDKVVTVSSPPIEYKDYPNELVSKEQLLNSMVGTLQRIIEYPKRGWQAKQEIPKRVLVAYLRLVELGFIERRLKTSKE